jgi:methionine-rich copper-binding protein CopC
MALVRMMAARARRRLRRRRARGGAWGAPGAPHVISRRSRRHARAAIAGFLAASGALLLLTIPPAAAHSLLLESFPAADTAHASTPTELRLRFNNRIEKRLSRLRLVDERGARHDLPVDPDGAADWLIAPLPAMTPGRYRVEWQVLSTDGHVVSGRFTFTVK